MYILCFEQSLQERMEDLVPQKQAELKDLKQTYGDRVIGEVTVNMVSIVFRSNLSPQNRQ